MTDNSLTNNKLKPATDYIKDGNGKWITLYAEGQKLAAEFVTKTGGNEKAAQTLNLSKSVVTKVTKYATCSPESWTIIYNAIVNSYKQSA